MRVWMPLISSLLDYDVPPMQLVVCIVRHLSLSGPISLSILYLTASYICLCYNKHAARRDFHAQFVGCLCDEKRQNKSVIWWQALHFFIFNIRLTPPLTAGIFYCGLLSQCCLLTSKYGNKMSPSSRALISRWDLYTWWTETEEWVG
jgi:hypothetical protein